MAIPKLLVSLSETRLVLLRGNAYLVYQAYGRVQKFSDEGELIWDASVPFAEKDVIFDRFIEENSGGGMM
ncbi:MAG: hypothetical protein U5K31_05920 [Balneolaceae bacterium]|nr:hypothetical protein [Balneolaceae bacterium]